MHTQFTKFPCHLTSVFINQLIVFNAAQSRILWEIGRTFQTHGDLLTVKVIITGTLEFFCAIFVKYCLFFRRTFSKEQTSDLILLHKITYLLLFCLSALAGKVVTINCLLSLAGSNWKIRNLPTVCNVHLPLKVEKGLLPGHEARMYTHKRIANKRIVLFIFIMYYLDDGWASSSSVSVSFNIPINSTFSCMHHRYILTVFIQINRLFHESMGMSAQYGINYFVFCASSSSQGAPLS